MKGNLRLENRSHWQACTHATETQPHRQFEDLRTHPHDPNQSRSSGRPRRMGAETMKRVALVGPVGVSESAPDHADYVAAI